MNKLMDKLNRWLEEKFMPVASKIASNRYMMSVKNSFFSALPFIMVGSIFVIIAFLAIPGWDKIVGPYLNILYAGMNFTSNLLSVWIALSYGYHLAEYYELDPLVGATSSLMGFLIAATKVTDGAITMGNLGGAGIFTAILIGTFSVELYRVCIKYKITFRMPESVPPKIATSFGAIVPILFEATVLAIISHGLNFDITEFIMQIFRPLVLVGDSLPAVMLVALLVALLFYVGIQGWTVVLGVIGPIELANIQANVAAHAAGDELPHVLTEPFFAAFSSIGGTTMAGALVILLMFCKSKQLRQAGKISIIPSLLVNVNEPAMFSVPTVLNPYFFIPVVFVYPLAAMNTWIAMNLGWVTKPFVNVAWSTPMPFYPYLATGGDFRAIILMLFNLAMGLLIYYPFVKAYDKACLKQEQQNKDALEGAAAVK